MKKRFDEFEAFLDEQTMGITDYDEVMVRQLIKKTTLFDDRLFFEFMAGIEIEVQIWDRNIMALFQGRLLVCVGILLSLQIC